MLPLLPLQTLHNHRPQLRLLVSCAYSTDHGKKGQEEGVYNRKIINTDMPSLTARQSLAAQERPQGLLLARCVIASCGELSCYESLQQVPFPPPLLLQPREFSVSQAAKLHLWVIISSINYCVLPNYSLLTHSVGLQEQCKVGKQWHLKMIRLEAQLI